MNDYAYLEIGLRRRDAEHYALKLCFVRPAGEAGNQVVSTAATTQFDFAALDRWGGHGVSYGQLLVQSPFADAQLQAAFDQACGLAQTQDPQRVTAGNDRQP